MRWRTPVGIWLASFFLFKIMKIKLKGNWETKKVWLNGLELALEPSQKIRNHSPDGFNWGYGGSGPAQLSLAICLSLYGEKGSNPSCYQNFKWDHIEGLPQSNFDVELEVKNNY